MDRARLSRIENLGIARVLERGTAEVIADTADVLLVRDRVSGAYLLACDDVEAGLAALDGTRGLDLLMVSHPATGRAAFARYGFAEQIECYQVAYYGPPPAPPGGLLTLRPAQASDLPLLTAHYHRISPEELARVVDRDSLLLGYEGDRPVGFIGEHLEGSMGLLYVLPDYRRRGFATALETAYLARTLDRGQIPFGQVETDNAPSLRLQEKLGLTRSDSTIFWMWK